MSTPETRRTTGAVDDLLLKVTPPRVPRHLVARPRLLSSAQEFADRPVILVQAPAGFGKTSLLAQWRLEHLAHGTVVAWLSAQQRDDPQRLAQALALGVRQAAGRPTFGHTLLETTAPGGLEGITIWLAELAHSALNVVLIVDEADRLPAATREALGYVLRNAPPNLRAIIAARTDCELGIDDLVTYGQCIEVGAAALRFRLEETMELVRSQLGNRVDNDTAARLHELTEGWPLGLQMALSVIAAGADARSAVAGMAARGSGLHEHFVGLLIANLATDDVAFLTRISILEHLHPELCRAVSGYADTAERLARLGRDTPVFIAGEQSDWLRMHALARDALLERLASLPEAEQAEAHARAAAWLDEHELLEYAARHAFLAGQQDKAYQLAERSLYEAIVKYGRQGAVLEWLVRLPAEELDRRPRLLLAGAWSLALGERHEEAERLVARVLRQAEADDALRCECALILGGAAIFADLPDRFAELHEPWSESPPLRNPMLLQVHANRTAYRALLEGEPSLARLRLQQAPRGTFGQANFVGRWSEFITAFSYLWEGQVMLAGDLLHPGLASAEAELGRRSSFACLLAALLAAAAWERDRPDEAAALLADRLDVLERSGLPDALMLAYRTMASIAVAAGAEHRAIELMNAMEAVGTARRLPRLVIASLADRVRMHAGRFRVQTCSELCGRIDEMLADPSLPQGRLWRRSVMVLREMAHARAAIAAQDWRAALGPLERTGELARALKLGRLQIEVQGLRAYALDRCGEKAEPLMREAMDLAQAYGLKRVFADAHPDLDGWVRKLAGEGAGGGAAVPATPAPAVAAPQERLVPRPPSRPGMALTAKEREVLELLARNLSNKEIGRAMQAGETTIKWHVKNLFGKLDAGTRKEVVLRARVLGLLPPGP